MSAIYWYGMERLRRDSDRCAQGGGIQGGHCQGLATHEHLCGESADYVLCLDCAEHQWTDDDGGSYVMDTRRRDAEGATFPLSSLVVDAMLEARDLL